MEWNGNGLFGERMMEPVKTGWCSVEERKKALIKLTPYRRNKGFHVSSASGGDSKLPLDCKAILWMQVLLLKRTREWGGWV